MGVAGCRVAVTLSLKLRRQRQPPRPNLALTLTLTLNLALTLNLTHTTTLQYIDSLNNIFTQFADEYAPDRKSPLRIIK